MHCTSSVLFDGVTPTLTELDGDTWAEQLMVLDDSQQTSLQLDFNFIEHPTYPRPQGYLTPVEHTMQGYATTANVQGYL